METLVPELPVPSKPKRWLPSFSLRALLFVVLCLALGGSYSAVIVREAANREAEKAQTAAGELPARWQELKEAVKRMDPGEEFPKAVESCEQFLETVKQANSIDALRAALGEPDQPGGGRWMLNAVSKVEQISVTVDFDGLDFDMSMKWARSNYGGQGGVAARFPYPNPQNVGTHSDAFVLAAGIEGMLVGAGIGLVVWVFWRLVQRWRRMVVPNSKGPAAGNAPTSP